MGSVQMNFLRLLSSRVYQNVTFNCVNSIIWFDAKEQNYAFGVRLMGESGQEWSANRKHIKPNILQDQCTVRFYRNTLCIYSGNVAIATFAFAVTVL